MGNHLQYTICKSNEGGTEIMFRKIEVDNFKSLIDFSIDLTPMSVIVGNNASGKSSILQVIHFMCQSVKEDFGIILERRNWTAENIKSKLISSNKVRLKSLVSLPSEKGMHEYVWEMVLSIYSSKNEVSLLSESLVCDSEELLIYQRGKEGNFKNEGGRINVLPGALAINSSALRMLKKDEKLDSRTKNFIKFLEDSSSFEMLSPDGMRLSSRGIKDSIGMSGRNLPSFIKQMTVEQKKSFKEKLNFLLNTRLLDVEAKTQGKPGWTQIDCVEGYKNKSIRVSSKEMSDGMLRLLAFVAISEIRKSNAVMLLDEVENGINMNYAEKLLKILENLYQEKGHQLILTTHSTVFMDYIKPDNIVYLYRNDDGYTKAVHLFASKPMKDQLECMYPGEVLLNMSQAELLDKLLNER